MTEPLPTCCERNGINCREGRDCPERGGYLPREQARAADEPDTWAVIYRLAGYAGWICVSVLFTLLMALSAGYFAR